MGFFLEVLIGGLLAGVLYSLVALGFVLIFKASGVFNFAQGAMVLTAALALVRALELFEQWKWPFWLALIGAFLFAAAIMAAVAWLAEKLVLRKLVNQEGIILFMATIGLTFFLEGLAQTLFGADVYPLNIGLPKEPIFILESLFDGGILVERARHLGGRSSPACWSPGWRSSSRRTRIGRALRAVADDHAAAQSVGIPLNQIWFIVWLVAGLVALVAGAVWGSKLGVQFSLSLLALKALPVLILGGFTSVPGAIIGGLIIGAGEKLAEVFLGPVDGRRHRDLVRLRRGAAVPAVPAAGPVRRAHHRARVGSRS